MDFIGKISALGPAIDGISAGIAKNRRLLRYRACPGARNIPCMPSEPVIARRSAYADCCLTSTRGLLLQDKPGKTSPAL
jgi:hypothetical protein